MRRWITSLALLTSCGPRQQAPDPYTAALRAFRDGNSQEALRQVRIAQVACADRAPCRWRARLLEAEILIGEGATRRAEAASILTESPPDSPPFAEMQARLLTLRAAMRMDAESAA